MVYKKKKTLKRKELLYRRKIRLKKNNKFNRGNRNSQAKRYYQKYAYKTLAQATLRYAVKTGKIIKPLKCEFCGDETKLLGHHEDYNKRLEVIWLCWKCHNQLHVFKGDMCKH